MLTSGYETMKILLWITHILDVLLALFIQQKHIWARVTFLHLGWGWVVSKIIAPPQTTIWSA